MNRTLMIVCALVATTSQAAPSMTYRGICDASAVVETTGGRLVVATDEGNDLMVYEPGRASPVKTVPLSDFLAAEDEADIEGVTVYGGRQIWITSHGLNKKGKKKESRFRLFATEPTDDGSVEPSGRPYHTLISDLLAEPRLKHYDLKSASKIAPKSPGGLNIEGLTVTTSGEGLLIGSRSPLVKGKALVIELTNPAAVIEGAARAAFGQIIEVDLDGLGMRAIEAWPEQNGYVIIAGPTGEDGDFTTYWWSGSASERPKPMMVPGLKGLKPESVAIDARGLATFVSDDGTRKIGGRECKDAPKRVRAFRSARVPLRHP